MVPEQLNIHKEGNGPQTYQLKKIWIIGQNIKPNYNSRGGNIGENFINFRW